MDELIEQEKKDFYYLFTKGVELKQNVNGSLVKCVLFIESNKLCIAKNKNSNTVTRIDLNKLAVYSYGDNVIGFTTIYNCESDIPQVYHIHTNKTYIRDYIIRLFSQISS